MGIVLGSIPFPATIYPNIGDAKMKLNNPLLFEELSAKEQIIFSNLVRVAESHDVNLRAAGGWVRDKLLGIESHDIDIAVQGMSGAQFAQVVLDTFNKEDKAFSEKFNVRSQTVTVIEARPEQSKHLETAMLEICGMPIDFAGLRSEEYGDSRIPTIREGTPEEDAMRRDLTINALFFNLHTKKVEDYTDGLLHLAKGVANVPFHLGGVEKARKTFVDDPLRVLRVIRFAAKYDLEIGHVTKDAMRDTEVHEALSNKISKERIWAEMFGIQEPDGFKQGFLCGPNPHKALEMVYNADLEDVLFTPKYNSGKCFVLNPWETSQNNPHHDLDIINHTLWAIDMGHFNNERVIGHTNEASAHLGFLRGLSPVDKGVVTLALMLHDIGKRDPDCIQSKDDGTNSYLGHDDRSVELGDIVLDQLGAHKAVKARVLRLIKHHMRYHVFDKKPTPKALRKIVRDMEEDWELLLMHSCADSMGKVSADLEGMAKRHNEFRDLTKEAIASMGNSTKVERPINGHDLMGMGIPGGKVMGELFDLLDEQLLETPEMTRDEALSFVREAADKRECPQCHMSPGHHKMDCSRR